MHSLTMACMSLNWKPKLYHYIRQPLNTWCLLLQAILSLPRIQEILCSGAPDASTRLQEEVNSALREDRGGSESVIRSNRRSHGSAMAHNLVQADGQAANGDSSEEEDDDELDDEDLEDDFDDKDDDKDDEQEDEGQDEVKQIDEHVEYYVALC